MVGVGAGRHELTVRYRYRETGLYGEAPYVDEWKPLPPRLHHTATLVRPVELRRFAVAEREVTNAEFAAFRSATGYRPVYSWLHLPVLDRKGQIRHDGGVVAAPGMYLIGMPFLRRRKSALIDGAGADARDLSDHLVSYLHGRVTHDVA